MEKLIAILRELHPEEDFTPGTELLETGLLDSFDIVTIVAQIDEEFGVVLPPEALIPENFETVKSLYRLIESLGEG